MTETSRTDWKRLDKLKDEQVDTSDAPELGDEFFARARTIRTDQAAGTGAQVVVDSLE
jgi:hypothetical protein